MMMEAFKIDLQLAVLPGIVYTFFFVIYHTVDSYISKCKGAVDLSSILPANCLFAIVKRDISYLATSLFRHLLYRT